MFRMNDSKRPAPQHTESSHFPKNTGPENSSPGTVQFGLPQTPQLGDAMQTHSIVSHPSTSSQIANMTSPDTTNSASQDLPPYDLLYSLVDIYFKHINTWCPILVWKPTLDRLFGPNPLTETDRILMHAIVATSMRYSTDPRLTEQRREHYHRISKQKVLLYGMENSSVTSLQSLVILALDLCGSSNGPPGWNIMALITRSVVQLGLAVETNSFMVAPNYTSIYTLRAMVLPEPQDFVEDESRRRLFWMIYLLDRYATIATAFEFALDDKEIDRTLPCHDDFLNANQKVQTRWFKPNDVDNVVHEHEFDQPQNLGALAYYIEILGLLSRIHKFLKKPINIANPHDVEQWQQRYKELDNILTGFKYSLPPDYGDLSKLLQSSKSKDRPILVMLHATFNTAIIRLHSSAAYPTTRSNIFTPSYSASQRCLSAVENIATIAGFVTTNSLLPKLGPPFAFTIWVSARLLLVHGSTVERKLSPKIHFFVDKLREMGRYWPVAARYCGLLQRVLDEQRESDQQGDGVTPSSVTILADMRRTAFDLDFLISRQPRHGSQQNAKFNTITPTRTPGPNELEYLDVFDFFNVPRLPVGLEAPLGTNGGNQMGDPNMHPAGPQQGMPNEFNITNFMMDANSDWLFKQEGEFIPQG